MTAATSLRAVLDFQMTEKDLQEAVRQMALTFGFLAGLVLLRVKPMVKYRYAEGSISSQTRTKTEAASTADGRAVLGKGEQDRKLLVVDRQPRWGWLRNIQSWPPGGWLRLGSPYCLPIACWPYTSGRGVGSPMSRAALRKSSTLRTGITPSQHGSRGVSHIPAIGSV